MSLLFGDLPPLPGDPKPAADREPKPRPTSGRKQKRKKRRRSKSTVKSLRQQSVSNSNNTDHGAKAEDEPAVAKQRKHNNTPDGDSRGDSNQSGPDELYAQLLESVTSHVGTLSDRLNAKHKHFDSHLASVWKTQLTKSQRRQLAAVDRQEIEKATLATRSIQHDFTANPDDHCETSVEAYADIVPLLRVWCAKLGKSPAELKIYDPYFCAGSVKRNLASLGFTNVYNENEDFYKSIATNRVPQ